MVLENMTSPVDITIYIVLSVYANKRMFNAGSQGIRIMCGCLDITT